MVDRLTKSLVAAQPLAAGWLFWNLVDGRRRSLPCRVAFITVMLIGAVGTVLTLAGWLQRSSSFFAAVGLGACLLTLACTLGEMRRRAPGSLLAAIGLAVLSGERFRDSFPQRGAATLEFLDRQCVSAGDHCPHAAHGRGDRPSVEGGREGAARGAGGSPAGVPAHRASRKRAHGICDPGFGCRNPARRGGTRCGAGCASRAVAPNRGDRPPDQNAARHHHARPAGAWRGTPMAGMRRPSAA